ncbi:MAG: MBL fold metallo-hydrolase [Halobacteria archaeon]
MKIHHLAIPSPFPIGPNNVFLLEGDPLTLVDTGVRTRRSLKALEEGLEALGHPLRSVERVIVTHGHQDHFGMAREIRERSGAAVWVHAWDTEWLETYDDAFPLWSQKVIAMGRKYGLPRSITDAMEKFQEPIKKTAAPVEVERSLDDGDRFRVGDAEFRVFHTPGHCPGEIVLDAPGLGAVFSGDHVLRDVTPNPFAGVGERGSGLGPYLASLKRVEALDPRIAYTGHRHFIDDWKGVVRKILRHHEARKAAIRRALDDLGGRATAYEMAKRVFPRVQAGEISLALAETLGHLEVLEAEGAVETLEAGGVVLHRKA